MCNKTLFIDNLMLSSTYFAPVICFLFNEFMNLIFLLLLDVLTVRSFCNFDLSFWVFDSDPIQNLSYRFFLFPAYFCCPKVAAVGLIAHLLLWETLPLVLLIHFLLLVLLFCVVLFLYPKFSFKFLLRLQSLREKR